MFRNTAIFEPVADLFHKLGRSIRDLLKKILAGFLRQIMTRIPTDVTHPSRYQSVQVKEQISCHGEKAANGSRRHHLCYKISWSNFNDDNSELVVKNEEVGEVKLGGGEE